MKKSRLGKMMILVLAIVTVFAFSTTAFASWDISWTNKHITGGNSQIVGTYTRSEPNSMDVDVTSLTLNGQSGWKFRGYLAGTGTKATELQSMYTTAYYCADYTTTKYVSMDMKMSIASSSTSDYLIFSGDLYF